MADTSTVAVTGPAASELLRAVHRVRDRLEADLPLQRHLTQALASAAGVPASACPWRPDSPLPVAEIMSVIVEGITGNRAIGIEHLQQDGEVRSLDVEPYHVRLESGFWYLIARLAETGDERVFRIDKIMGASPGPACQPRPVDLDRYLGGVFVPPEAGTAAVVRFGPRSATYAAERWGEGNSLPHGGVEIRIPYQREHFLIRNLAEFGDDYEVVSPLEVREGVRARAAATLASYGGGG